MNKVLQIVVEQNLVGSVLINRNTQGQKYKTNK